MPFCPYPFPLLLRALFQCQHGLRIHIACANPTLLIIHKFRALRTNFATVSPLRICYQRLVVQHPRPQPAHLRSDVTKRCVPTKNHFLLNQQWSGKFGFSIVGCSMCASMALSTPSRSHVCNRGSIFFLSSTCARISPIAALHEEHPPLGRGLLNGHVAQMFARAAANSADTN